MTLDKLFNPEKIAVVGASRHEGKTGHEVYDNLAHDFEGEVYPVNPNADEVEGEEARDEIEKGTDLAVIVVPGKIVPKVMDNAGNKGVDEAIVISAGFSETGNESLESEVRYKAVENDIDLLGPNVLGLINTENSMNASFASRMPEKGGISFMSQSGAFCTAILDYAKAEHIGFRHFVSLGNKAMLNEVDMLEKWKEDETEAIISYTEGIEDGREFMEIARKVSDEKPIVIVKSGRTEKGGEAASSHTGSIAGSIDAYRAAFRQTGIIEAESSRELLEYGRALTYQPLPDGKNIAIVTNAGGPGVITSDEVSERGMKLAEFSENTRDKLEQKMPDEASPHNPMDVIGDAGHKRYEDALEAVLEDENVDAVITILTPQANTEIEKTAKTIANVSEGFEKPVLAAFMGEKDVSRGVDILEERGIPDFQDPKDAVKTLKQMSGYREYLETEQEFREIEKDEESAEDALENFSGYEDAEQLLDAYGFDLALTEIAEAPQNAVEAASRIGYPVTMKIESPDIAHKTDIGAVKTGVETREEVKRAFNEIVDAVYDEKTGSRIDGVQVQEQVEGTEVALGVKMDPQFGPVVMVGLGGIYIEALDDVSFGIPPISDQTAEQMIEELQASEILEGTRGEKHSIEPVKDAIIRLGELALDYHEKIQSMDINPLILDGGDAYVADIQIELEEK
ncbi:MAG: acetate--CoA ligase family protein [Candidatus Nanosalina sp.]